MAASAKGKDALIRVIREMNASAVLTNQQAAAELGVYPTDLQVLNLLGLKGPMTPKALANLTGLTTGGVTVVLDRLEKQKLIIRRKNPADRRSLLVEIPKEGMARLMTFYRSTQQATEAVLDTFTDEELHAATRLLSALIREV
ncbi:MAG: MarR family transcriptional regulator [Salinarimonas sp.]|nr:MarR family transcriptional regulator [Salinarimonas sp.]